MANVYIEQYRNILRDDSGAPSPVEGALIPGGSAVLDSSGSGASLELEAGTKYIYIRSAGDVWGGWTDTPADVDNSGPLENDRFDLTESLPRWKAVEGTHFSVKLKA